MGVWNVVVDVTEKKVVIENRRHTKELNPEVAIALNQADLRPYKKVISPVASIIDSEGKLVTDEKAVPIDIVSVEAVLDVAAEIDPVIKVEGKL